MATPIAIAPPEDTANGTDPHDPIAARAPIVRFYLGALGVLLLGYMFMGRGFAHLGFPPLYVGELVLGIGLVASVIAVVRCRPGVRDWRLEWVLLGFMALGAARTVPYIPEYGWDALRDGTLWGYGLFALTLTLLVGRRVASRTLSVWIWVIPVFAIWLPVAWNLFVAASTAIDPSRPGEVIPLVFFKSGDMAVHVAGACALLVLGTRPYASGREFLLRALIGAPLLWTAFIAAASNRGALVTLALSVAVLLVLATRRRNWFPLSASLLILIVGLGASSALGEAAESNGVSAAPIRPPSPIAATASPPQSELTVQPGASTPPSRPSTPPSADPSRELVAIPNSGFEFGPLNSGRIEGWTVSGVGTFNIITGEASAGTRFATLSATGSQYETWIRSSVFPFVAGDDVFVDLSARAIDGRPRLEIHVRWLDSSGKEISTDFLGMSELTRVGGWQRVAGALKAPEGTAEAQLLLFEARGTSTVGIDQVTARAGEFIRTPPPLKGRSASFDQILENLLSVFMPAEDRNLEGTKQFRLAWWGAIVDYTVFGDHFWTGKGFGVNLADADGFQATADGSLRAPHNSHLTVLARMGVPGFLMWIVLQAAFAIGVLRAAVTHRTAGDHGLAGLAGCLLAYWAAMMVDTSFDPYLEGPQGGIWFWSVFGMGLVLMRLARPQAAPA